jgi:hypothetical protein
VQTWAEERKAKEHAESTAKTSNAKLTSADMGKGDVSISAHLCTMSRIRVDMMFSC